MILTLFVTTPSREVTMMRRRAVPFTSRLASAFAAPTARIAPVLRSCATAAQQTVRAGDTLSARNIAVSRWLFGSCALVGGIVVVGGITRLTESGLSIVEWKPIRGVIPPITQAQWEEEFAKYKQYPEFQQKPDMTLAEFQSIFFWEWLHRVLARSMGIVYGVPLAYFMAKGYFSSHRMFNLKLFGCLALGGGQGLLGWYMVRSGLDNGLLEKKKKATVSAYRLAAHLSLAFTIYACMLRLAFSLRIQSVYVPNPIFATVARICTATMFVTAISGAFVAGLDAGLLYCDTFPYMGESWLPPVEDVITMTPMLRNLFENPSAAQLWHRTMAGTTTWFILTMNYIFYSHNDKMPAQVRKALKGVNHALAFQVLLGFATLMSYVATPIAVLHQMNSMALLTMLVRLCATVARRPRIVL
jgi:cytochrome c oxidase assembly protein subunit 15